MVSRAARLLITALATLVMGALGYLLTFSVQAETGQNRFADQAMPLASFLLIVTAVVVGIVGLVKLWRTPAPA